MRTISLDGDTVKVLKEWKERQASMGNFNFVLSYDGNPMLKSTISRIIKRYAKLANVPQIQAKELRHSSPETPLKHYAHLWSGVDKELADEMTGLISIQHVEQSFVQFNGNQALSNRSPKLSPK